MKSTEGTRAPEKDARVSSSDDIKKQIAILSEKINSKLKTETSVKKAALILASWISKKTK